MGPTCSIFFENEPEEKNLMTQHPRSKNSGLFERSEILISLIQGLLITAGVLSLYYFYMNNGYTLETTRTMVFTTLVISNILLTLVNRSFTENLFSTIRYKNNLVPIVIIISILFLLLMHLVPAVRNIFGLTVIGFDDFLICIGISIVSVLWFELYKTAIKKSLHQSLVKS